MSNNSNHCIFCDITAGSSPSYIIHEDELSLCILDIQPFTKGHCLVIPKRHVQWWQELSENETVSLFNIARAVSNKIMETYKPDFVCMYARGRRIPHTHIFLVPTYKGDVLDQFFNALEGFQENPVQLAALRDKIVMEEVAQELAIKK